MAPPSKKQRMAKSHTPVIKPREWLYGKPQPGANTACAAAAQRYAQPVGNKALQNERDAMARKLAIKSLNLKTVVDENNALRRKTEELEAKLAAAALQPTRAAAAPPPSQPSKRERELEATIAKLKIKIQEAHYNLRAQNYFDNRARHYAYRAALTKAQHTRPMHNGSKYLALRPTLPYQDYPEGPVIYSLE